MKIKAVNYHLWEPCNMRCKFCFATFQDVKKTVLPKGHLPKEESIKVVKQLIDFGFDKITFVGGEPTLCPWLSDLISTAKKQGATTMIVTNGTNLTEEFLSKNTGLLDWITISIDSLDDITNLKTGRAIAGKKVLTLNDYKSLFDLIKKYNYRIKINTVVNSENYQDDLVKIIEYAEPERWKIFQVLPVKGQNDENIEKLKITEKQFNSFIKHHLKLNKITKIVTESNEKMKGSYAMVDPAGRFFDNIGNSYRYSDPILISGTAKAFNQVSIDSQKFIDRGGVYDWGNNNREKSLLF